MGRKAALLWLDMEMTGLDPDRDTILEYAAVVTDWDLNPLGELEGTIFQSPDRLAQMDEWNQNQHRQSGLLDRVRDGISLLQASLKLESFILEHFQPQEAILAGNTIAQDRLFLRRYMPSVHTLLHYRMLDVSSWKVLMESRFGKKFKKQKKHRAKDDIYESIAELQFYLSFLNVGGDPSVLTFS